MRRERNKGRKALYTALAALCLTAALGCVIWLLVRMAQLKKADDRMQDIRDSYVQSVSEEADSGESGEKMNPEDRESPEGSAEGSGEESEPAGQESSEEEALDSLEGYDVPEKEIDFEGLRTEQNPDIYAWIHIPDTPIDYPVLQHPEEMDYYLNHNLDGSRGYPGCIYSQLINAKDWTDRNTVLYGHNMSVGTMFKGLHYYEDPEFFEEHPYVYIYTEEHTYVYQVFAAYEYGNAHLILGLDIDTDEKYQKYLDDIFSFDGLNNNFDTEVEVTAKSRILTLSTCVDGDDDRRWLVQAVLVAEGET